ncbi:hypothetical protein DYBT9275_05647 [Dyadobacter sp. CECT 9275]|uniref:Lipoprotein n=1 Tax=Dyadobacter helix TaxID=2822344 RepID=A0A916NE18_9BACT|nr:hypothetical protein [Dyadobacter sp. CECT 9275]CAG5016837.1 hypothetical protein DYBT9275_05647 [Dyadobacter sp. CECT 9275]
MKRLIKATMRNATLAGGLLIFCAATSCGKNEVERDMMTVDKAGSFNIDGSNFRGKSSVQKFGNGNYSILCEQEDPYKLIQITFHSQAEAETGGTFKVGAYSTL